MQRAAGAVTLADERGAPHASEEPGTFDGVPASDVPS